MRQVRKRTWRIVHFVVGMSPVNVHFSGTVQRHSYAGYIEPTFRGLNNHTLENDMNTQTHLSDDDMSTIKEALQVADDLCTAVIAGKPGTIQKALGFIRVLDKLKRNRIITNK